MIIIVPVHSFIDVITNSSSEIFVVPGNKSIETIKEVINAIAGTDAFLHMLSEPVVCPFNFDIQKYPKIDLYRQVYSGGYNNKRSKHPFEIERDTFIEVWEKKNPSAAYGSNEYDEYSKKYREEVGPVNEKWYKFVDSVRDDLRKWAFEQNGLVFKSSGRDDIVNDILDAAISYEFILKKGDIVILSQGDNTVPYGIIDAIDYRIGSTHHHLG